MVLYTATGGLHAKFMASYLHTTVIFAILITMIFAVYIKVFSSDTIYDYLKRTNSYTESSHQ